MKQIKNALAAIALALFALPAFAWDGVIAGTPSLIEVNGASPTGLRVTIGGVSAACAGGPSWAYIDEADTNFKTTAMVLNMAKVTSTQVTIYTYNVGGNCKIGYLQWY